MVLYFWMKHQTMKVRTMLRLISLGTNLYLISQDKELMEKIKAMAAAGKEKYDEIFHKDEAGEEDDEDLLSRLTEMASEMKEKMAHEMESVARKTYDKMKIAHADEVSALRAEIERLRVDLDALKSTAAG